MEGTVQFRQAGKQLLCNVAIEIIEVRKYVSDPMRITH